MRPGPRSWMSGLLAALALAGFALPGAAQVHRSGEVALTPGETTTADGRTIRFELGVIYVPENRAVAGSRVIGVGFARIRAAESTGAPPLFMLPGGPGNSYLNALTDHDAAAATQLAGVLPFTAAGDVILVDQRGWTRQGERLELADAPRPLDQPRSAAAERAAASALARAAVAANPTRDLAGYTIIQCAEDVNDLRRALGYDRIVLVGQSFGSQWSLAVMKLHPRTVARAVLSGTEPLAKNFDMPSQVFAALQRIAWDADLDAGLGPYLPPGGVIAALTAVRERIAAAPVSVTVDGRQVVLGVEDLQASLIQPAADWPAFVLELYHGHYERWAAETLARRTGRTGPVRLIQPLIDSSIGASPDRVHQLRGDPALPFIGVGDFDPLIASASDWPTPDMGDTFRLPVRTTIPTVFIQGDWDTSTPMENMLGTLPYFPNSRAILVHRAGHQSRGPLFAQAPDVLATLVEFLRTGQLGDLPAEVSLAPPAFRVPSFPAPKP